MLILLVFLAVCVLGAIGHHRRDPTGEETKRRAMTRRVERVHEEYTEPDLDEDELYEPPFWLSLILAPVVWIAWHMAHWHR